MYVVYLDQPKSFECSIKLEGASLTNSKARLIMETGEGLNFIFNGSISEDGKVNIPVTKLKHILKEEQVGKLVLEVIADDIYFSPWTSEFLTALSRKVEVSVTESQLPKTTYSKPTIQVQVDEPAKKPTKKVDHLLEVIYLLTKSKITITNIKENKVRVGNILQKYTSDKQLSTAQVDELITKLPQRLYELTYVK